MADFKLPGFPHDNLSSEVDGPIGLVTEVETSQHLKGASSSHRTYNQHNFINTNRYPTLVCLAGASFLA